MAVPMLQLLYCETANLIAQTTGRTPSTKTSILTKWGNWENICMLTNLKKMSKERTSVAGFSGSKYTALDGDRW